MAAPADRFAMTESQTRPCVLPPLRQGGYFGGRAQKPHHSDKLCAHTREVLFPSDINPGKTRRNLCIRSKTFLKIKSLFNIFFVLIPFSYCWCLKEPLKLMGLIYCARARVCVSKTHQERDRSPVVLFCCFGERGICILNAGSQRVSRT